MARFLRYIRSASVLQLLWIHRTTKISSLLNSLFTSFAPSDSVLVKNFIYSKFSKHPPNPRERHVHNIAVRRKHTKAEILLRHDSELPLSISSPHILTYLILEQSTLPTKTIKFPVCPDHLMHPISKPRQIFSSLHRRREWHPDLALRWQNQDSSQPNLENPYFLSRLHRFLLMEFSLIARNCLFRADCWVFLLKPPAINQVCCFCFLIKRWSNMISFYFLSIILQDCFLNEIGEMNVCECVSLVLCDRIRVFDPFLVFGKWII